MFSIDRISKNCIRLKLANNGNDYEITANIGKGEISINAVIKYSYSDNNRFCGNIINNFNIGNYYIRLKNKEDIRNTIDMEAHKIFNIIRSDHFPEVDKIIFEIFSVKIQDLYMEVNHA